MISEAENTRYDLGIIASWIQPQSRVLGLGCGEGELLHYLKTHKKVKETGIEIKEERVRTCIEKGLSVLQGDINEEILDYPDDYFDYVILSQTLQQVYEPESLICAMMKIGKKGIVSFPNFCHWRIRMQLLFSGNVPVTRELPYEWYDTPNIRVLSIKDFRKFTTKLKFGILKEAAIVLRDGNRNGDIVKHYPNLFATYGIFMIGKGKSAK
ncbi:MAG: methionine biosynthesis protein MetW [Desulfobacteraceae bacterium]|nr:MAG: methionine biosynthesis protein MetW [Desulfobacteraceae bacterium]